MSHFTFEEVERIYTRTFILSSVTGNSTATAFIFKIIQEKSSDPETINFLLTTPFLLNSLNTYFTESTDLISVSGFENLLTLLLASAPELSSKITSSDFVDVLQKVRVNGNSTLLTRLVDYIALIAPYALSNGAQLSDPSVYVFTRLDFMQDDPLLVILLISFYKKLLSLENLSPVVFRSIKPSLYDITYLFTLRTSDSTVQSFYAADIIEVLSKWSYSELPEAIAYLTEVLDTFQLFKSFNLYLDDIGAPDVRLLSEFNPRMINNEEFINDLVSNYNLYSKRFFTILLNLISSSHYFNNLISLDKISVASISKLPFDMLFRLIYELTKFKHSTIWLLTQPQLLNDYILGSIINENEIWNLKKQTLENLLWRNSTVDLGVWYDSIKVTYNVMCNGRNVKDIQPVVEVASEAQ